MKQLWAIALLLCLANGASLSAQEQPEWKTAWRRETFDSPRGPQYLAILDDTARNDDDVRKIALDASLNGYVIVVAPRGAEYVHQVKQAMNTAVENGTRLGRGLGLALLNADVPDVFVLAHSVVVATVSPKAQSVTVAEQLARSLTLVSDLKPENFGEALRLQDPRIAGRLAVRVGKDPTASLFLARQFRIENEVNRRTATDQNVDTMFIDWLNALRSAEAARIDADIAAKTAELESVRRDIRQHEATLEKFDRHRLAYFRVTAQALLSRGLDDSGRVRTEEGQRLLLAWEQRTGRRVSRSDTSAIESALIEQLAFEHL